MTSASYSDLMTTQAQENGVANPKHPFEYQKPSAKAVEEITRFREKCKDMYDALLQLSPSRERACAITNLEQVSMWANKHFAFHVQDDSSDTNC